MTRDCVFNVVRPEEKLFFCIDDPKNSNSGCVYESNLQSDLKKKRIKIHAFYT